MKEKMKEQWNTNRFFVFCCWLNRVFIRIFGNHVICPNLPLCSIEPLLSSLDCIPHGSNTTSLTGMEKNNALCPMNTRVLGRWRGRVVKELRGPAGSNLGRFGWQTFSPSQDGGLSVWFFGGKATGVCSLKNPRHRREKRCQSLQISVEISPNVTFN